VELPAPETLADLGEACGILADAVRRHARVRVFGDYDADGVTATALLVRALLVFGARVDWRVPNRFDDGYGLSVDAVREAAAEGIEVLVTVDCGSSSPEAAAVAAAAGVTLIVTDHHRLPDVWPEARCLISPERMSPKPVLSGAGVALQLARGVLGEEVPAACWALAAVGSVADVMPLQGETRAIVRRGLEALREGAAPGLAAILRRAGRDPAHVTAEDLAFAVAPRLNAAGRMGRPETAVEAGLAAGEAAETAAAELEEANQRRRAAAAAVTEAVEAQLAARGPEAAFLVAMGDGWHEGVIGIAAARAADRFRRPVAVIAFQGEVGKGSARGGGFGDVLGALRECEDRFVRLGGHFGAAGFTIRRDAAENLEALLSRVWPRHADATETEPPWPARPEELTEAVGQWLEAMEPFGPGWPRPRFHVSGEVRTVERLGRNGTHVRLGITGCALSTVCFDAGSGALGWAGRRFTGVGTLRPHWWRGECRYQIYWDEVRAPARDVAPLDRHAWRIGPPPPDSRGVLVLGRRRALAASERGEMSAWRVWSWWSERPPLSPGERWSAAYVVDPPPHRWALKAALAVLTPEATVYWHPRALDGQRAVEEWARRVPDRARLLRLWQARRDGRSPLLPGRRILDELGLGDGRHLGRKVALEASVLYRTAWRERREGEGDWARGDPFAWREEEQSGLAE